MSKVKEFFGTKTKARRRMRRFETRNKKLSRFRKAKRNIYKFYKGGYYPEGDFWTDVDQRIVNGHGYLKRYNNSSVLKGAKTQAARQFRRKDHIDEENYEIYKGSKYKRQYDIDCELW